MSLVKEPNRRGFMKMLAASPLLAQIAAQGLYVKSAAAIGLNPNSKCLQPARRENRHQLPRNVDVPQRLSAIS